MSRPVSGAPWGSAASSHATLLSEPRTLPERQLAFAKLPIRQVFRFELPLNRVTRNLSNYRIQRRPSLAIYRRWFGIMDAEAVKEVRDLFSIGRPIGGCHRDHIQLAVHKEHAVDAVLGSAVFDLYFYSLPPLVRDGELADHLHRAIQIEIVGHEVE